MPVSVAKHLPRIAASIREVSSCLTSCGEHTMTPAELRSSRVVGRLDGTRGHLDAVKALAGLYGVHVEVDDPGTNGTYVAYGHPVSLIHLCRSISTPEPVEGWGVFTSLLNACDAVRSYGVTDESRAQMAAEARRIAVLVAS